VKISMLINLLAEDGALIIPLYLIASVIGALTLRPMARQIGNIPTANFRNSFLVVLISGLAVLGTWPVIGIDPKNPADFSLGTLAVEYLVILAATYIVVGKMIWKCTWIQSVKANAVWIVVFALVMSFLMYKVQSMMPVA